MLKNYLTISIRHLLKNKLFLIINVAGLALAMSTCILAYLNTEFALNFDQQHVNADKIYKVQVRKESDYKMIDFGINPLPLGPAALRDIIDIKKQVRYTNPQYTVQKDDIVLTKQVAFADADFLDVFTFPLKSGDPDALRDKKNILLSEEMAEIYFADENPVGQILIVRNNEDEGFPFVVGGVFEKVPLNMSINFDALVLFDNYHEINHVEPNSWGSFVGATFFFIDTPEQARTVSNLLDNYIEIQNKARNDWKVAEYYMIPLLEFGHNPQDLYANWLNPRMHKAAVIVPLVMALLMLLIACFNFTNTSIAISSTRIKEIGIRKVMGGGKRQLIMQFMGENLLVCAMAALLSIAIASYLVPAYSAMWPDVNLIMDFGQHYQMYFFIFGLLIFTAILAGSYPAIYLSSFEPVKILSGTYQMGGAGLFSRILLSTQFFFTTMALFAGIAFIQNARYQETLDLGFNRDTIIGVEIDNHSEYLKMESAVVSNPYIASIAGTENHIGMWDYSGTFRNQNKRIESFLIYFGPNYIETMDLEMTQGRSFSKALRKSDVKNSLIVNEKMVEEFGWKNPLGQRVTLDDSTTLTVIGVVKNFYFNGFWRAVDSYGIRLAPEEDFNFLVAKVPAPRLTAVYKDFEKKWATIIPDKPFTGFYQDQLGIIKQAKEVNSNIIVLFSFQAMLSLLLSAIGLFTLVSLNIIRRMKEIGIRKVLGANIKSILVLMNKPFSLMILVGGSLGLLAGHFVVDLMIGSIYKHYKEASPVTFLIPITIIVLISFLTASSKILQVARQNPVDSLRDE